MKGFQVCILAVLGSLLGVQPALAQIGGGNERKADRTIEEVLEAIGLKYEVLSDGDLRLRMYDIDTGRIQTVVIEKATTEYYGARVRKLWSVGYQSEDGEDVPLSVVSRLFNTDPKIGAWTAIANVAVFQVVVDADADEDTLKSAINAVGKEGDKWERILTGEDFW